MDVNEQGRREPGPPRQQTTGEIERNTVNIAAQQLVEPDVDMGHERQRRQEMLTELSIGDPGITRLSDLEGQGIDQHRPAFQELDVVGAGVLERHAVLEGLELDVEGRERGVLERGERPLVGIRDEWNEPWLDHLVGPGFQLGGGMCFLMADEPSSGDQLVVQTGTFQVFVMSAIRGVDPAIQDAVLPENEPAWITKRGVQNPVTIRHCAVRLRPVPACGSTDRAGNS